MSRFTLYADAPADGGGAAVDEEKQDGGAGEAAAKPPVKPIAGAFTGTAKPPAEPKQDGSQAKPGAFDWKAKLPDDAPPTFKKYKSWEDVGKSHASLQAEMEKLKKSKIEPLTQDQWGGWFAEYLSNGELPETVFETIQTVTGLPPELAADFFAFMKSNRDAYIHQADTDLGGSVTYNELETWLADPDNHPFSPEEIIGFQAMAKRGDTAWLKLVASEYAKANGTQVHGEAKPTVPKQMKAPTRSGRPAGTGSHEGFKTREEYRKALFEAGGDQAKQKQANNKLLKTPQHVRDSWGRPT